MKNLCLLTLLSCLVIFASCNDDEQFEDTKLNKQVRKLLKKADPVNGVSGFILPDSDDLGSIPQDPQNPITPDKVTLGKLLFHETALGNRAKYAIGLKSYSCASCHQVAAGFQAGLRQGIGDGGSGFGIKGEAREKSTTYSSDSLDVQPIRSPTFLNSAYQVAMLWNGQFGATGPNIGTEDRWTAGTPIATNFQGFEGVETQALAGLRVHRLELSDDITQNQEYRDLFEGAFPGISDEDRYTLDNVGLAIAAYERVVLANQSPWQNWLKGETNALSTAQLRGAKLFFDKANCVACHTGPALNTMEFHALGMGDLLGSDIFQSNAPGTGANLGRGGFTANADDNFKFKVPQLYNLSEAGIFGHGGTFNSIREVVEYKNNAIPENGTVPASQLADEFESLDLSSSDVDDLVAFLRDGLRDPNLERYVPESLPTGSCFPNADLQSKIDLGCTIN